MGIDGMRVGGGRCPPLLVAGLIVACFLLVCNWWSLTAENTELLRQIDGLSQQLKLSAEQRDQCITLRGNIEERYKRTEDEVATLHVQLRQERELQKSENEGFTMCKIELESLKKLDETKNATIETLRLEKDAINVQVAARKEENKNLQEELEKVQDELNRLKLSQDSTVNKKSPAAAQQMLPRAMKLGGPHLGPVPEGAVEVSPSGQHGIKFYGIPILPRDPPGAVRQHPRFSVTMLKAGGDALLNNETRNGGNHELQEHIDARNNHVDGVGKETDAGMADNFEDLEPIEDSLGNQGMKSITDPEAKPNDS